MPTLARILVYPIKSLDPIRVEHARVLASGALEFDRQWAIVDASGKFINGKRTPLVHRLRTSFDERIEHVTFQFEGRTASFHLSNELEALESWLSEVFGQSVRLLENAYGGFPDDTEAPGPTVSIARDVPPLRPTRCQPAGPQRADPLRAGRVPA